MKRLLTLFVMLILSVQVASAGFLIIDDADAFLDGSKKSIGSSGGTISNVEPGQTLKIKFKFKNIYPSGESEIEDVDVEGVLESIDDGDDLDDEADSFDVRPARTKSVTLEFQIPYIVDEGDYDLVIEAEGRNESGALQTVNVTYTVEIDKNKHDVIFLKATLGDEEVQCSRDTSLRLQVANIGSEDEEDIHIKVTNSDLELSFKKTFDLDTGGDEDDTTESFSVPIEIANSAPAGTYIIAYQADYHRDTKIKSGQVEIVVKDCAPAPAPEPEPEQVVVQTIQDTTPATGSVDTGFQATGAAVAVTGVAAAQGSFLEENGAVMFLGLLFIVLAVLIVVVAVLVFRKKPRLE